MALQAADPFDVPRPDPAILVSAKSDTEQQIWFGGISVGLTLGTCLLVSVLSGLESIFPDFLVSFAGGLSAVSLGLIYAAIGVAHFTLTDAFLGIVPPIGTWGGLWQVPAPGADDLGLSYEKYHTFWSGAAEVGGGVVLAASGIGLLPEFLQQLDSFLLFVLTVVITPANIFQFTHDATMGEKVPPMKYPDSHIVRGGLQIVLLSVLWKLALH